MNQKILNQPILISSDQEESENSSFLRSFIPVGLAVFGSIAFLIIRIYAGGTNFISDGALMTGTRLLSDSGGFLSDESLRAFKRCRAFRNVGRRFGQWR